MSGQLLNFPNKVKILEDTYVNRHRSYDHSNQNSIFLQEDFITPSTFGDILYENFLFDVPKFMDICALYGGESSSNTPLLRKMLENIFYKQPK